jgi:thymidylate kinase
MLVGFMGAPCSGKTTTAARLFADLKEMGTPVEFITEKARSFIAWKKYNSTFTQELFSLTNENQLEIAKSQFAAEQIMRSVCGNDLIVLTDTTVLNSALYMTPDFRARPEVQELFLQAVKQYDLLFLCQPVEYPRSYDPNRVHSEEESLALHSELESVFAQYAQGVPSISLIGPSYVRLDHCRAEVLRRHGAL